MATLKDIDNLVELSVKYYKSDWYEYDRPRAERDNKFIIMLRQSGVDCLFFGDKASYGNMLWCNSCMEQERAEAIYFYNDGKLELINHKTAKEMLKKLVESWPKDYVEYCRPLHILGGKPFPSLQEYKEYKEYEKRQNEKLANVEPLHEWLVEKLA